MHVTVSHYWRSHCRVMCTHLQNANFGLCKYGASKFRDCQLCKGSDKTTIIDDTVIMPIVWSELVSGAWSEPQVASKDRHMPCLVRHNTDLCKILTKYSKIRLICFCNLTVCITEMHFPSAYTRGTAGQALPYYPYTVILTVQ